MITNYLHNTQYLQVWHSFIFIFHVPIFGVACLMENIQDSLLLTQKNATELFNNDNELCTRHTLFTTMQSCHI